MSRSPGMDSPPPRRILFAGYAPVHFLCFLPVYQRLARDPELQFWFSGGFRRKESGAVTYQIDGFYDPYPIDPAAVIPLDQARQEDFDVVVCAHTSDSMFPRHATRSVQIFHGVSFKNFAVREKVLVYDYLCIPGRYHEERFRNQNLIRQGGSTFLLTGFPKADNLVGSPLDREEFIRRQHLDPALPTLLYAPTGGKKNSLETMGREVISAISRHGRWNLLIKPHDHPKKSIDWFTKLSDLENDRIRLVHDRDIMDYLRAADLLISDASSVAVEYTLLDRPMVFIDVPKLLKNVIKRGGPLDLDTYGRKIGKVAHTPSEVVAIVQRSLADPDEEQRLRRAMAGHVFFDPGGAVERVAAVVRHAAGLQPRLPADIEVLMP